MSVTQVIGGASKVKGRAVLRACCDAEQCLGRCLYANQTTVFCHQHIATTDHMTAL